jgi:2-oxoglutarate ferredoxin oxidoreductase subunit beta
MSTVYKPADYKSELKPVWCPGCGDYGVLNSLHRAMAELQIEPWKACVVSGIGCSSRLPGYVTTYGFNSLHGRALPIASGMKLARPELDVIVVGGDGDGIAIGGNHLLHSARRNLDLTYIMMDNEIYGLTKGQAAPTTPTGDKTKSTIYGNPEPSVDPCELAISCGATWVARAFSGDVKTVVDLMVKAVRHKGFSFLNIISPCVTFRGDDQFTKLRAKVRAVPEDYDKSDRGAALRFTRETDVLTSGVLYEVTDVRSFGDKLQDIAHEVQNGKPMPGMSDILKTFQPGL